MSGLGRVTLIPCLKLRELGERKGSCLDQMARGCHGDHYPSPLPRRSAQAPWGPRPLRDRRWRLSPTQSPQVCVLSGRSEGQMTETPVTLSHQHCSPLQLPSPCPLLALLTGDAIMGIRRGTFTASMLHESLCPPQSAAHCLGGPGLSRILILQVPA